MSVLNIFGKILGNINDLKKFILNTISKNINKTLSKVDVGSNKIKSIILDSIRNQPEYTELKSGVLRNQLGLPDPAMVDSVLSALDDIEVKINRAQVNNSELQAQLIINVMKSDYSAVLSAAGASYTTEKGAQINWLEWLLLRGQDSVIVGYRYLPKITDKSRTGKGIMISGNSAIYRVPPAFAGTVDDNWITRGIDAALPEIEAYINNLITRSL